MGLLAPALDTVNGALAVATFPSEPVAAISSKCAPSATRVVSNVPLQPTFGQPFFPGYTTQTSGRAAPYEALPYEIPSTTIATFRIVALESKAQPKIGTIPL